MEDFFYVIIQVFGYGSNYGVYVMFFLCIIFGKVLYLFCIFYDWVMNGVMVEVEEKGVVLVMFQKFYCLGGNGVYIMWIGFGIGFFFWFVGDQLFVEVLL